MKAKKRALIGMAVCLVVLAALLALVTWMNSQEKDSGEETIYITNFESSALSTITYTFNGQTVELVYDAEAQAWHLKDLPDQPLQATLTGNMASAVSAMKAKRQLEDAGDLSQYGLDAPSFTVTATAGEETYTFLYGDQNQMTQDRYLMLEGSDAVYTVDETMYSAFQYAPEDLFEEEEEEESASSETSDHEQETASSAADSTASSESVSSESASSEAASSGSTSSETVSSESASSESASSQSSSSDAASSTASN